MSVANVAKLFYRMDHEVDVKEKVDAIIAKYSSPDYSGVNREEIIEEELIPLGKELGMEFTLGEFTEYLLNPSLQKLYETARVVGGSPDDPDFGKKIAARVAEKSLLRDHLKAASALYDKTYGIRDDDINIDVDTD